MYAQHFGLNQDPFSIAPDPRYLFMSERHREALAHLLYGVTGSSKTAGGTGGGFVLLTGDIGTGKTTICRCFLEQIPANCHVAYIFNPKLSVIELMQSICEEFHVTAAPGAASPPSIKDFIDALNLFLLQSHAAGQNSVLIIDEAQNLAADVLEQLRLLTNLETNERKLLQIVLIGQPELRDMLARPELEQLAQRVIARFHLDALSDFEATQYISHRLSVAGHTGALPFKPKALQRIHRLTRGVPRRINLLCGRALLGAWANGLPSVNCAVVDKAAAEVFGIEPTAYGWRPQRKVYFLTSVSLLLSVLLAGFWLWPKPSSVPVVSAAAPRPQVAGSQPARSSSQPQVAASRPIEDLKALLPQTASAPVAAGALSHPIEDLQTLLPKLPTDINKAWRELAIVWGESAPEGDPCQAANAQPRLCYSTKKMTIPVLRQLNRPGILTLQSDQDRVVHAVLVGLSDQTATLRLAGQLHAVRLVWLSQAWHGEFATFWQPPAGDSAVLRSGSSGPAVNWLANHLSVLDGAPPITSRSAPAVLDDALRARVRAFQQARGITPDGHPGPMTFMQIESATNPQAPHLIPQQR
jgi:general secretion pathway protein A